MLTPSQVQWASRHDWFIAYQDNGQIIVADRWFDCNSGRTGSELILWDRSFSALRLWAGY